MFLFSSEEGKDLICQILRDLWPYTPRDHQLEAVAKALDGTHVLAILPTARARVIEAHSSGIGGGIYKGGHDGGFGGVGSLELGSQCRAVLPKMSTRLRVHLFICRSHVTPSRDPRPHHGFCR